MDGQSAIFIRGEFKMLEALCFAEQIIQCDGRNEAQGMVNFHARPGFTRVRGGMAGAAGAGEVAQAESQPPHHTGQVQAKEKLKRLFYDTKHCIIGEEISLHWSCRKCGWGTISVPISKTLYFFNIVLQQQGPIIRQLIR